MRHSCACNIGCYIFMRTNHFSLEYFKMAAIKSQHANQEEDVFVQSRVKMEKNLTSPDKTKREIGISMLCLWLTSQKDIKEEELVKIWKGLFYCLRHAENAKLQTELIDRMGNLLERLDVELSLLFFKAFLRTLRREWGSFDKECVDGFHLLLRHYVFRMFAVLQKSAWHAEVVGKFIDALAERALLVQDGVVADDVTLSVVDFFLPELKHYLPIAADVFESLLEPFWMTLAKGGNKRVAEGIREKVFLLLFDHGCRFLSSKQGVRKVEEEIACFGTAALSLSISIREKSTMLLPCASEVNAVQLKLIQEKFTGLVQSNLSYDFNDQNFIGKVGQSESNSKGDMLNSVASDSDGSCNISPLQFLVTRTFGRRSKRNQKLAFSPHTDTVYEEEAVSSQEKPENKQVVPVQESDLPRRTMKDYMSSFSKNHECREGRGPDKRVNIPSAARNNDLDGETIGIDGSPPRQEAAISEDDSSPPKQEAANIEGGSPPKQEVAVIQEEDTNRVIASNEDGISMEDPVISNLTRRFESIADQSPCLQGYSSPKVFTPLGPSPINTGGRKRKSWRCSPMDTLSESPTSTKENIVMTEDPCQGQDAASIDNIAAKKAKKVHFSLQHNIVWKPSTPLPPQSLRVPPSATPRGSALKKGLPPGPVADPIEELLPSPKKKKKATPRKVSSAQSRSLKNARNSAKVTKPVKRGRLSPR